MYQEMVAYYFYAHIFTYVLLVAPNFWSIIFATITTGITKLNGTNNEDATDMIVRLETISEFFWGRTEKKSTILR